MKSLLVNSNNFVKLINFFDTSSTNSFGDLLFFLAASSTFCPCSSVPVINKTSCLSSFLYLATVSATKLVYACPSEAYHLHNK